MSLYPLFKKMAFSFDPEVAHEMSFKMMKVAPSLLHQLLPTPPLDFRHSLTLGSLKFPFPVGIAAGLDKEGEALRYFSHLPIGMVEAGTVTVRAQPGNPKPRLWRYPDEESLRNAMGFNNSGALSIFEKIKKDAPYFKTQGKILGINLGKNKDTPNEKAFEDYYLLYKTFAPLADYLVINISSPNTPNLRALQNGESIRELLAALKPLRSATPKPLFIKLSCDLSPLELDPILNEVKEFNLSGVIATNTSIDPKRGSGGVSGRVISEKARSLRKEILVRLKETPDIELIGVGGVSSFDDLWDFWKDGGRIMQIYSSFIFGGPPLLAQIKNEIDALLLHNQTRSLEDLLANIEWARR